MNIKEIFSKSPKNKIKSEHQTTIPKLTAEEVKLLMDIQQFHENRISPAAKVIADHFQSIYAI